MKKALIGGFLSILGTIWGLATAFFTVNHLVASWTTPPGRFLSTVFQTGMLLPFVIGAFLLVSGLVILGVEYFKKGD